MILSRLSLLWFVFSFVVMLEVTNYPSQMLSKMYLDTSRFVPIFIT